MVWPPPNTGPVLQPGPPRLAMPGRHRLAFLRPDALGALHVDDPAGISQQGCDPAISVTLIAGRKHQRCRASSTHRRIGRSAPCAAWIGAPPGLGKAVTPICRALERRGRCRRTAGRGSPVSPCDLCRVRLLQRQVRYGPAQTLLLLLKFPQPSGLIGLWSTEFFPLPKVRKRRHPDRADRFRHGATLRRRRVDFASAWRRSLRIRAPSAASL